MGIRYGFTKPEVLLFTEKDVRNFISDANQSSVTSILPIIFPQDT